MAIFHQYDYIFAIGTIFAFLDAWNIGANDVANSWATSVASRSVTYIQAMILGGVMEVSGAVGAGARVTDTIRTKIVSPSLYKNDPGVLMLGMLCAVVASASFLTVATRLGFPVSTTHSILGGVLGMGIATVGASNITWVQRDANGKMESTGGVVTVFFAWFVSPCIAGGFAAVIFLFTKYAVLLRKNPVMIALYTIPLYFGVTASLLCMLIVTKGGQIKSDLSSEGTAGIIIGSGVGFAILITIFLLPWIYRKVIREDWDLQWYHVFLGPLVLNRGEVPPPPPGRTAIRDFYAGHLTKEQLEERRKRAGATGEDDEGDDTTFQVDELYKPKSMIGPKPEGTNLSGPVIFWYIKWIILRGVDKDVVSSQNDKGVLAGDIEATHASASHFDNKVEYIFAFLQVMTASTASFTHGANDVANAIGPFATIYEIWMTGQIPVKKAGVPIWILCFGGGAIILGLWTYGYHIMKNLGNRLTLLSPSRGFSAELGSAITIIVATKLSLPVSTTQCITGATVAIGLCNGTWRAINWRIVAWIYLGWIITLPMAGIVSGCLMGFVINAPHYHNT